MASKHDEACMEFAFVRDENASRREKVRAFWKFLDEQSDLQPHKGAPVEEALVRSPTLSAAGGPGEKNVWLEGLRVFRRLGLDRTALAADNRCELCLADRTTRCRDLADTVAQPYEELNADMKAFERHREAGSALDGAPRVAGASMRRRDSSERTETRE